MKILLLGSGGREHALAWKIAQSPRVEKLYIAPGNPGTRACGENVDVDPADFDAVAQFVIDYEVEMLVVGPEAPLVEGIADYFAHHSLLRDVAVIGPGRDGARLEGSKDFAKGFMQRHGIPTAAYQTFGADQAAEADRFLRTLKPPYVLKADGLAAGKGVLILNTLAEAQEALRGMWDGMFGTASQRVVIEEFLAGVECSVFCLTDGTHYQLLPEAKDYKRIGEGDTGPNTGGMGSVSPVPFATPEWLRKVEESIVRPTVDGLRQECIAYKGFIFFGLMNCGGEPKVIEYNCRMGDPETETVMLRLQSDLVDLFEGVAQGDLDKRRVIFDPRPAACVMCVSGGYPGHYEKGFPITGTDVADAVVFHAGTRLDGNTLVTSGGRVIAVSAYGSTRQDALRQALNGAEQIQFQGKYFRHDIGRDLDAF